MTKKNDTASKERADHRHESKPDNRDDADGHSSSKALHKLIGEVGTTSHSSAERFGSHSGSKNQGDINNQVHGGHESAMVARLTGDEFPALTVHGGSAKKRNSPPRCLARANNKNAEKDDIGSDVHMLLDKTGSDKSGANADLVDYLSTLNHKQVGELQAQYKHQFGDSFTDAVSKKENGDLTTSTSEAMPYLLKGVDDRTASDDKALAEIGAKTGGEDGKRLIGMALENGLPASDAARQDMQDDKQFLNKVHSDWKGGLDAKVVNDYVHQGYISLTTIAGADGKNKSDLEAALDTATPEEHEEFSIGKQISDHSIKPANGAEKQALQYYDQLDKDFKKDGDAKDVKDWENELTGDGPDGSKGKPDKNGFPAGGSAQHDLALALGKGAHDGGVEDASAETADRAVDQYVSAVSGANAQHKQLTAAQTKQLNNQVSVAQKSYDASRQKYNSDHQPWWKEALSIAGDVAIGAAAIALAPETGGSDLVFAAGLIADGAFATAANGLKTDALGGHYDWSAGNFIKNTAISALSIGLGKYVVPAIISKFGTAAAQDTTGQIAAKLDEDPETSSLDGDTQKQLTDRLAPALAKSKVSGRLTEGQVDDALSGIVAKESKEYKEILPIIEENTATHVLTPSQMDGLAERLVGSVRVNATDLGINAAAGLGIKTLLSPISRHLDERDVQGALVSKGTIKPVASIARTVTTETLDSLTSDSPVAADP